MKNCDEIVAKKAGGKWKECLINSCSGCCLYSDLC